MFMRVIFKRRYKHVRMTLHNILILCMCDIVSRVQIITFYFQLKYIYPNLHMDNKRNINFCEIPFLYPVLRKKCTNEMPTNTALIIVNILTIG